MGKISSTITKIYKFFILRYFVKKIEYDTLEKNVSNDNIYLYFIVYNKILLLDYFFG